MTVNTQVNNLYIRFYKDCDSAGVDDTADSADQALCKAEYYN